MASSNNDYKFEYIKDDYTVGESELPGATLGTLVEYPSEWFKANPGEKPSAYVANPPKDSESWNKMLGYALKHQIDPKLAVRFMYDYSDSNFRSTLRQDWESYNVVIDLGQATISPMSVLRIVDNKEVITSPEGEAIDEEGKMTLFCILLAGYRYGLAAEVFQGDYKIDILKRINLVVRNEPISLRLDLTVGEVQGYNSWINNLDFRMLIAALDMFWIEFPDSTGSQLRVCTLNSRYKDCSSISELRHLSQMTSLTIGRALEYIFFTRVRDEVVAIGRPGEEFEKEDSYFPYMRELRLSKKSPYSSSANVHLHNWVSIFSALLGSERSYNARIVSEDGILSALNLAIFSAYAFK